jgi:hypothetical protein
MLSVLASNCQILAVTEQYGDFFFVWKSKDMAQVPPANNLLDHDKTKPIADEIFYLKIEIIQIK